ncbi:hypothetical protein [Granulicella sibirica]|uniref:DUF4352 domain-containing protein n=1 Tax=Granulicella sibirica TaxID=2479048 RepID=A0A4Q0T4Q9_9BACT|nr:hypothetical protein [Granulicella sibirica]RXH57028.1 hypothetical protein GRAN_0338 [Granulicella sibirica]
MPDPTFAQPARSPILPLLIAAGVLALIAAGVFYFNPHDTASLSLSNTSVVPTQTTFKSQSIVVGEGASTQDDLYVFTTLKVDDHLRLPITINTITASLITGDNQESATSAISKSDLPAIFIAFPKLKPLAAPPLLRETTIAPGQSAEGQLVFHFPVPKSTWDTRKSATITLDLYHQTPQTIVIP